MGIGETVLLPVDVAEEVGNPFGTIIDHSRHDYDFVVEVNVDDGVRQLDFNENELLSAEGEIFT